MTVHELVALIEGQPIGRVLRDRQGRLTFVYEDAWRRSREGYPISLSMPLAAAEHPHTKIETFLWGLLPDNATILDRWARRFKVSARNPFALIANVGEDCAGAVQFVLPDRVDALQSVELPPIEWIDEDGVAERLAALRADQAAWRIPRDTGQFSLAGAQPKTALLLQKGRWGVPSGRIPTTHILKPPSGELDGHAENEFFCLALARALGLPAADAEVKHFRNEVAIVIKRYDRYVQAGAIHRIHQEDVCQALSCLPTAKYENEGGPGTSDVIGLLRTYSTEREEDVRTFMGAIIFNWLVAGTDAHAKNYSVLIAGGGGVRLAPLYDIASALPYGGLDQKRLALAMRLGGHYKLREISFHNWVKFAKESRLDADEVFASIKGMIDALPDEASRVDRDARHKGLDHKLLATITDSVAMRARECGRLIEFRGAPSSKV